MCTRHQRSTSQYHSLALGMLSMLHSTLTPTSPLPPLFLSHLSILCLPLSSLPLSPLLPSHSLLPLPSSTYSLGSETFAPMWSWLSRNGGLWTSATPSIPTVYSKRHTFSVSESRSFKVCKLLQFLLLFVCPIFFPLLPSFLLFLLLPAWLLFPLLASSSSSLFPSLPLELFSPLYCLLSFWCVPAAVSLFFL